MGLLQQSGWSLIGGLLIILLGFSVTSGQGFKDESPSFNYDTLPSTTFSCKGRLTGRYYADAETDCQLFHVCVKMNGRDVQDFKFLCPNGTTFDQEHQVCMDYFQVVCHSDLGTNPLGSIYELLKLSSIPKGDELSSGKLSFVDPDVAERNTLGDDFQVDEYNNNRLASSQNSFRSSFESPKSSRAKSSDIFYKNAFTKVSTSTYRPPTTSTTTYRPSTTTFRTTTSTTTTPTPALLFRSPIPSRGTPAPSKAPRRPSLETFESYEIESVNAYGANQNSFNVYKNYDDSYEAPSPSSSTTTTTTRSPPPQVFHNTYRASPSTAPPTPQTFQQQPTRFNDDFFRKLPPSQTESPLPKSSKYAQFYVNSNTPLFYEDFSPKVTSYRTTTPLPPTTSTFRSFQETSRASFTPTDEFFRASDAPARQLFSAKTTDRGLSNRGGGHQKESLRESKFFSAPQSPSTSESDPYIHPQGSLRAKITPHSRPVDQEEVLRPRSFSGTSSSNVNHVRQFSSVPPPTTADPLTESTTFRSSGVTNLQDVTYFNRVTTQKPEKFSIFFGQSTTYANKEYTEEKYSTPSYEETSTTRRPIPTTTTSYYSPTTNEVTYDPSRTSAAAASFDSFKVKDLNQFTDLPVTSTTGEYLFSESTTTTVPSTTTGRPVRRGQRRRVSRPRTSSSPPTEFDSEVKYSRRVVDATQLPKFQKVKNALTRQRGDVSSVDEIFNAEASVYNGQPKSNIFQEDRKESVAATTEASSEGRNKLVENFGRKIRPGGLREQFVRAKQVASQRGEDAPVTTSESSVTTEQPTQQPRRLIKRLKVKTTLPPITTTSTEPSSTSTTTTTTTAAPHPFIGGSTLRPVKRINVKTKILGTRKLEKTFDSSSSTFSTKNPFAFQKLQKATSPFTSFTTTTSTTTEEPQLITASDDEILRKKSFQKLSTPFGLKELTTPTTFRPPLTDFPLKKNSTSSVIIKVPKKSQETFPISFKEPILSGGRQETRVEVKASTREESSSATRSPDYDYAYYNSDNDDDYANPDAAARLADSKNYGKKPSSKTLRAFATL